MSCLDSDNPCHIHNIHRRTLNFKDIAWNCNNTRDNKLWNNLKETLQHSPVNILYLYNTGKELHMACTPYIHWIALQRIYLPKLITWKLTLKLSMKRWLQLYATQPAVYALVLQMQRLFYQGNNKISHAEHTPQPYVTKTFSAAALFEVWRWKPGEFTIPSLWHLRKTQKICYPTGLRQHWG